MIYRFAFVRTKDEYLKITDSAKGMPSLTAIHLNTGVFEVAARLAGVSEQDVQNLTRTAEKAQVEGGLDVCCEAIELDSEQINHLGFGENWYRLA